MLPLGTFMPRTETSTAGPFPGAQRDRSLVNSSLAVAVPETSTKPTTAKRATYYFILKLLELYVRYPRFLG